jgi:hypothetical protein
VSGPDDRDIRAGQTVEDEPFLSRWARLKRESRAGRAPEPESPQLDPPAPEPAALKTAPPGQPGSQPVEGAEEGAAGAEPEALELPPLDALTPESDFTPFMRPGVPAGLRAQALRKMFQNPKYGVVDELDPFRADFAAFTPLGDTVTAQMRFHAERLLREEMERVAESLEQGAPEQAAESGPRSPEAAAAATGESPSVPMEEGDERRDS